MRRALLCSVAVVFAVGCVDFDEAQRNCEALGKCVAGAGGGAATGGGNASGGGAGGGSMGGGGGSQGGGGGAMGGGTATGGGTGTGGGGSATGGGGGVDAGNPLEVSPLQLPFGGVEVGTARELQVSLRNGGSATLTPTFALTDVNDFGLDAGTCGQPLAADAGCELTVRFAPLTQQSFSEQLAITAGAANASVSLQGSGIAPQPHYSVTPSPLAFPVLAVPQTADRQVRFTNTGQLNIMLGSARLDADAGTPLTLTGDTCSSRTLAPDAGCDLTVHFAPLTQDLFGATLVLTSPVLSDVSVPVTAEGFIPVRLTVRVEGSLADAGQVEGFDGGLICGAQCVVDGRRGMTGQLTASFSGARGAFSGFDGGGCGLSPGCAITVNADTTVTARFDRFNRAFVTSNNFDSSNLAGAANRNAICVAHAADAGLVLPGSTWWGLVSDSSFSVLSALNTEGSQGWLRLDGQVFARTTNDFIAVGGVQAPILFDERGAISTRQLAWTGLAADGDAGLTCLDWTSFNSNDDGAIAAVGFYVDRWGWLLRSSCGLGPAMVCLEVGGHAALPPRTRPAGSRLAFLSGTLVKGDVSDAVADAICNSEAQSDGGFLALRGSPGQAPLQRLNLDGGPWVRADGFELTMAPLSTLATGAFTVPLNLQLDGGTNSIGAWTGASLGVAATLASTCKGWTAQFTDAGTTLTGVVGYPAQTWTAGFNAGGEDCASPHALYCFER